MKNLFFLFSRSLLFLVPPILYPTGLYITGDPDIISIADGNQRKQDYRVSKDNVGAQFKFQLADNSLVYIYINRDEKKFNSFMNPPINEFTEEKLNLISLSDKKLIIIFHQFLKKLMSSEQNWSIENTINVIHALDSAVHQRSRNPFSQKNYRKELQKIQLGIEEAKEQGYFDKLKTKSSISPRIIQSQVQYD